ncbi:hypothetical protein LTR17_021637 [Elasticomyces elasticus]|nr:hypothetical protein LTR17_021637 [Elasticomyces elasticus]
MRELAEFYDDLMQNHARLEAGALAQARLCPWDGATGTRNFSAELLYQRSINESHGTARGVTMDDILQELDATNMDRIAANGSDLQPILDHLKAMNIRTLHDLVQEERRLWKISGPGLPKTWDPSTIEKGKGQYTESQLAVDMLKSNRAGILRRASSRVYWEGLQQQDDALPADVLCEMHYNILCARKYTPFMAIYSLNQKDSVYGAPQSRGTMPSHQPEDEQSLEVLLSSRGAFTDIHIDHGLNGSAYPIGSCRKIVFSWPATTTNLLAFEKTAGLNAKFMSIGIL